MEGESLTDDTFDLLREFLPQIEQELRQQIEDDLSDAHQAHLQAELQRMDALASEEFTSALATLDTELQGLKSQRARSLQEQVVRLGLSREQRDQERLEQAQERFIQLQFEERVIAHERLGCVREELLREVALEVSQAHSGAQERRARESRVRAEAREQRERQEIDRAIREELLVGSGAGPRRTALESRKVQLASAKSKYNLKVGTLTRRSQELRSKIQQSREEDAQELVEQMERELLGLREEHGCNDKEGSQEEGSPQPEGCLSLVRPALEGAHFLEEDVELSSESVSEVSFTRLMAANESLPVPPYCCSHPAGCVEADASVGEGPVLDLDVVEMLRSQWREDPLDRFLKSGGKENDIGASNRPQAASFKELYSEHLKQLNQGVTRRRMNSRAKRMLLAGVGARAL